MTLYVDPSFFVLLILLLIPAAVLGLCERPLRRYSLVASVIVLACVFAGDPVGLLGLVGFLALARVALLWLAKDPSNQPRFVIALIATLGPLICYKISASFGQSFWGFLGISYITFKAAQIVFEVHDGLIAQSELGLEGWLTFLLFFPQFSAGPIDRSRRFAADANRVPPRDEYAGMLARGILLIFAGAVYSLVIANWIHRFYNPAPWGSGDVATELFAQIKTAYLYGLYLFFDFAGGSLMAMGASYCLGIYCPRNFRAPFAATNLIDFWNRWHITLSTWFRDFVFMRLTRWLMRRHLLKNRLTIAQVGFIADMVIMGMWHGLTPSYLCYGLYHGVLLAGTEALQKRWGFWRAHKNDWWFKAITWFITLQLVMLGFALFSGQISMLVKGALNV